MLSSHRPAIPQQFGFTLIELLVVIAIIAVLAVVVVLTLNPAQLLQQSRDANRVSDMATLNSAINLYTIDQTGSSLGTGTTTYISVPDSSSVCNNLGLPTSSYTYHCATTANYRLASSSGWLPINFQNISSGAPFGSVPVDPVNQTSTNLYYTYATQSGQYALSSFMESSKYAGNMKNSGGSDPGEYQIGSGVTTLPSVGRGLAGYWNLDEGSGSTPLDWSGNGANMAFTGGLTYTAGKVGAYAITIPNSSSLRSASLGSFSPQQALTAIGWINYPSGQVSAAFDVLKDSFWSATS